MKTSLYLTRNSVNKMKTEINKNNNNNSEINLQLISFVNIFVINVNTICLVILNGSCG